MRKIVFDIETKNVFEDTGSNDPASLDLSVICIYDSETDSYSAYEEHELPKLWPILEKADMFITFNGEHFDIPILNKYYSGNLSRIKSVDLLKEVKNVLGRRIKLDTLAEATLGKKKSGHGLDAILWWRNGEIDKIKKYCIEDVKITKEIYDYALKNKSLKYTDNKVVKEFKLDTSGWEKKEKKATLNHTLPF